MKKIITIIIIATLALAVIMAAVAGCGVTSYRTESTAQIAHSGYAAPAAAADSMLVKGFGAERDGGAVSNAARVNGDYAEGAYDDVEVDDEEPVDYGEMAVDSVSPPNTGGGIAGPAVTPVVDVRKIIKNVDLQLQTMTFDTSVESIPEMAESYGGYIQDSYVEGRDMYNERGARHASFTVRIPSEKLDSFVNSVGSEFNVISKNQNSQDITESYYDSRARLEALKAQEQKLNEMLDGATELEYMIQIEDKLMSVRYEIESITSSLNRMDSYVSLSTVYIYLNEVIKYEQVNDIPVTFSERISRAFSESWENFLDFSKNFAVTVIAMLPFLILLAVIVIILVAVIRKSLRNWLANRSKTASQKVPASIPPVFNSEPAAGQDTRTGDGEDSDK